jgi:hypothetical protein
MVTKQIESLEAQIKLVEVKLKMSLRHNKEESDSLGRSIIIPSLLSIHEDRPVAPTTASSEAAEIKSKRNAEVSPTRQRSTSSILSSNSSVSSSSSLSSSSNASSRVSVNYCKYSEDIEEFNTVNKYKYILGVMHGRIRLIQHVRFHKGCFPKLRTLKYNYDLYLEYKQRLNDHVIVNKDN